MAKVKDVEMARKDEPSGPYQNLEQPTEYRPINWKKILLTPKYIRMLALNDLMLHGSPPSN
jgi:hypothetical protein